MLCSSSAEESPKITSSKNFSCKEIIKNAYREGKEKIIETVYKFFWGRKLHVRWLIKPLHFS
jgi:hypothetical protein